MGSIAEKLSAKLTREKKKVLAFFGNLSGEIWEQRLYADGAEWSVQQVLAHIVEVEQSLSRLFVHVAEGGSGVAEDFDIDLHNKSAVESMHTLTVEDLLDRFSVLRDDLILKVSGWTDEQYQHVGRHPFLGEAKLEEMIRLFYLHINLHIRDVKKIQG